MPVQEESLNSGVRANPRSRKSLNSGVRANPRSRRITQQWCSGQPPFKKNHSTVWFGPIAVQEESLNSVVRANPCSRRTNSGVRASSRSRRITEQWGSGQSPFKKNHLKVGFGQSPFKKNHSKVGFGPIPVEEESLNSAVRANPRSKGSTQQRGSALNSGVRIIPVQEESLNRVVRANPRSRRITQQWGSANPRSRRITQQWGSDQSPFKKNQYTMGFGHPRSKPFSTNLDYCLVLVIPCN